MPVVLRDGVAHSVTDGRAWGTTHSGADPGTPGVETISERFLYRIQRLLPRGRFWTRAPGSRLSALFRGLSQEFGRVVLRVDDLALEADPRTATEMLPDWERFWKPYAGCEEMPPDIASRRLAVLAKVRARGGQSTSYFLAIAETLGYTDAVITRMGNPLTCVSPCNAGFYGGPWMYTWLMTTTSNPARDDALVCLIRRNLQAHRWAIFDFT